MTKGQEKRMNPTGLYQLDQTLVSGNVRWITLLILLAMAIMLPQLAGAATVVSFSGSYNGFENSIHPNTYYAFPINAIYSGTLTNLGINLTPGEPPTTGLSIALFHESAGSPGAFIVQTANGLAVAGWNNFSIPFTTITSGNYWIVVQSSHTLGGAACYPCTLNEYTSYPQPYSNTFNTMPVWVNQGSVDPYEFQMTYVTNSLVSATGNAGNQYETSSQTFTYNVVVPSGYATANVALQVNGANILWNNQTVTGTYQTFNFNYLVPLLASNALTYTFNAVLYTTSPLTKQGVVNTIKQTELYDYIPAAVVKNNAIITGGAQSWYVNFTNPVNTGASVAINPTLFVGNQILTLGTVLSNKYYYVLSSFVPSLFGITNPTGINSISVPYSANTQLTYNSNSVWRNTTGTPFTVNAPTLLACTAYTANAFSWNFFNATTLDPITENVLLAGYFTIKNGLYSSNAILGTSAGFTAAATSNTYQTCMFPHYATFQTYGTFSYGAANFTSSAFLLVNQSTSNVVKPINLYLQYITNPSSYDIVVERGINNPVQAYVQELLYNPTFNSSVLVNEFQTPVGAGYVTNLQTNSYYQFKAFNNNGQLLNTTPYIQASCAAGSTCTYYIQLANISITTPTQYLGNIAFKCASTPNIPANTIIESCSVASINGAALNATLSLWKGLPLQNALNCTQTISAASFNLACTAHHVNNHTYVWQLTLTAPYGSQILQNGNLGTNPPLFGNIGILVAIILVAAMGLVFISVNPGVAIILAVAGMIMSGLLALITLNVDAMGFLVVFLAIVVFALRGRG